MKRGNVLILVFGLILMLSYITKIFLKNINTELSHISQINRKYGNYVYIDSILSIIIANLYSYINCEIDFNECRARIDRNVRDGYGEGITIDIVPQDGKIGLNIENLSLIRQFLFQIGMDSDCIYDIEDFLEKKDGQFGWAIEELLQIDNVERFLVKNNKIFAKDWRVFSENVTTEDVGGFNPAYGSDEVLQALCSLEGWNFNKIKRCINQWHFSDNPEEDILQNLYSNGFVNREFLNLKSNACIFVVTISSSIDYDKCSCKFLLKLDHKNNYNGFLFKVIRKLGKT